MCWRALLALSALAPRSAGAHRYKCGGHTRMGEECRCGAARLRTLRHSYVAR